MLDGKELRQQPLSERKKKLEKPQRATTILYMEHVEKEGLAIYAGALALQLEGIVAKDSKARTWKAHEKHGTGKKLRTKDYKRWGK